LRQCIRPVYGVQSHLALMESARMGPHKAIGHEDRFFSQANHAPVNGCAISSLNPRKTGWALSTQTLAASRFGQETLHTPGLKSAPSSKSGRSCSLRQRLQHGDGCVPRAVLAIPQARIDRASYGCTVHELLG
jgi:hypothetical protein